MDALLDYKQVIKRFCALFIEHYDCFVAIRQEGEFGLLTGL
jgi:hypothetical protein